MTPASDTGPIGRDRAKVPADLRRNREWFGFVAVLVVGALPIANLLIQRQFSIAGLLIGVILVVLVFALISAMNVGRASALRAKFPAAHISQVAVYGQVSDQLFDIESAFGASAKRIRSGRYATLVADPNGLQLYGGVRTPRLLFEVPRESIEFSRVSSSAEGRWVLSVLEVILRLPEGRGVIDLPLVTFSWGVPRALTRLKVELRQRDFQDTIRKREGLERSE